MTISRVKPANWSAYEKLTSAQINQVDTNTSYALDKRSGQTDTLSSGVLVDGYLNFQTGSYLGGTITFNSSSDTTLSGKVTTGFNQAYPFDLKIADRASDASTNYTYIHGQKPYASATSTNGIAGSVIINIPASTASNVSTGSIAFQESNANLLSLTRIHNPAHDASLSYGVSMTTSTGFKINFSTGAGDGSTVGGGDFNLTAGNSTGNSLNPGAINITAGSGTGSSITAGQISLTAGSATSGGSSIGGSIYLSAGQGSSTSGTVQIVAGGAAGSGTAGNAKMFGGAGGSTGGYVSLVGGATVAASGVGGAAYLLGGASSGSSSTGGNVNVTGGAGAGAGGDITLQAGSGTAASAVGGAAALYGGNATAAGGTGGNVWIAGGTSPAGTSAGHIMISGGYGGTSRGNIAFGTVSVPNWQSGQGIWYVNNSTLTPGAAPTNGCFLWFDGTNLKIWKPGAGASATII